MRKIILFLTASCFYIIGCSKDDDSPECDSCTVAGEKVEMCDNEDGTYTLSYAGETEKVTQEALDLLEVTAEDYLDLICALGAGS